MPFSAFRLKNTMMISNLISNIIGVSVVLVIQHLVFPETSNEIRELGMKIDRVFLPLAFVLVPFLMFIYELPYRRYFDIRSRNAPINKSFEERAFQKLLNEPFVIAALDFGIWISAAVIYSFAFRHFGFETAVIHRAFFLAVHTGLITLTAAFFVCEFVLQRRIAPVLFPEGGLSKVPGTLPIRIRVRLIALLFACNVIPLFSLFLTFRSDIWLSGNPLDTIEKMQRSITIDIALFIAVGIWLTFLISNNLSKPLQQIIGVLKEVRHGHFESKVRVTSNDEIGYVGDVINEMTEGLKEREIIRETFGKYVSAEIRDEILSGKIPLDGEIRNVTVMFADLRDFTPMVESTSPQEVVKVMNRYFERMAEAIQARGGLILQFLGDEIYAVFGAPIAHPDHACKAVFAALDMGRKLKELNAELTRGGKPFLRHGIGIHTGSVLAANIGSPDRLSYLLIGDTVNTAARLQELTKEIGTEILISENTHTCLPAEFLFKSLPPMNLRGKSESLKLYALP